jgi:hypothetical protein
MSEIQTSFSQREACICINSILKTSKFYKILPQDQRGQLILFLKEKYFPNITNEEIRSLEGAIINQSNEILSGLSEYGINVLGASKLAEGYKGFIKMVGNKNAKKVKEILDNKAKSKLK